MDNILQDDEFKNNHVQQPTMHAVHGSSSGRLYASANCFCRVQYDRHQHLHITSLQLTPPRTRQLASHPVAPYSTFNTNHTTQYKHFKATISRKTGNKHLLLTELNEPEYERPTLPYIPKNLKAAISTTHSTAILLWKCKVFSRTCL